MDITSIALSGLKAAETRTAKAANNIANANTDGFKPDVVTQRAQDNGGVIVEISKGEEPVSLEREIVDSVVAQSDYEANLAVLRRQRELDKSLLDIQA